MIFFNLIAIVFEYIIEVFIEIREKNLHFMNKITTTIVKIAVTCLIYGLAGGLTQKIWRQNRHLCLNCLNRCVFVLQYIE